MPEPEADLLPTVTLQHRYGEQRLLVNRTDYIRGKNGRFRNWLLADDDPALQPPPCPSLPCPSGPVPAAPAQSTPVVPPAPARSGRRHRRGRRK